MYDVKKLQTLQKKTKEVPAKGMALEKVKQTVGGNCLFEALSHSSENSTIDKSGRTLLTCQECEYHEIAERSFFVLKM